MEIKGSSRVRLGALHLHTDYSHDGRLSLKELRDLFLVRGLSFLILTEHAEDFDQAKARRFLTECRQLSTDNFLLIPGFEVVREGQHILEIGNGALRILAHPHRGRFKVSPELAAALHGIEIWNGHYDGKWAPRASSWQLWRRLRRQHPQLLALAGLDFHDQRQSNGPLLEVAAEELTAEAILESLRAGQFIIKSWLRLTSLADASWLKRLGLGMLSDISLLILWLGRLAGAPPALKKLVRKFI